MTMQYDTCDVVVRRQGQSKANVSKRSFNNKPIEAEINVNLLSFGIEKI